MRLLASIMAVLITAGLARETQAQTPSVIALLPFENVSGSVDSVHIIMPLIAQSLHDRGYQLIPLQKV
ncbi:MAG: hypothetical protein ACM3TN_07010, partial [Alphaproteobacteria bacterium]